MKSKTLEETTVYRLLTHLVFYIALATGIFHLLNVSGVLVLSTQTVRILHLGAMLLILLLQMAQFGGKKANSDKFRKHSPGRMAFARVAYIAIGILAVVLSLYLVLRWKSITMNAGVTTQMDTVAGFIVILLIVMVTFINISIPMAIVVMLFLVYPIVGRYLPGLLHSRAYSVKTVSNFLFASGQGIYGIPIGVSSTYIVTFSIFGAFLNSFGTGDFFFKISQALTKGLVAAAAKTSVIFSALVGMISGSAAGNVAISGTFTIPMMKKEGYRAHEAGAIEAVVSTGGQIMPPIMGAAAFLMAEIIGIEYRLVMKAAVIPALIYFAAIFAVVHFQAKRDGRLALKGDTDLSLTVGGILRESWYHIFSLGILIYLLISGFSPFKAAFVSILVSLGVSVLNNIIRKTLSFDFIVKVGKAISAGILSIVPIAVACAAAGIISGILSMTGLGSKLSTLIVHISGGIPLVALFFTMIVSVIIGMGLPTTAAYLVLASVVAPALSRMGIPILTAHMFVFYFGCISTITPPVALASFVAAGIADAPVEKVSWTAFRYGLTSYLLPYMFVYGSSLMLAEENLVVLLISLATAFAGSVVLAMGIVGFMRTSLGIIPRFVLVGAGILLMLQGFYTDIIGVIIILSIGIIIRMKSKPDRAVEPEVQN